MSDPTALSAFAHRFTDLLKQGDFDTAINDLHADDAVTVEACDLPPTDDNPPMPRVVEGLDNIKAVSQWWMDNNEVHRAETKGPFLHLPDRFSVYMTLDVTPKVGLTAGERQTMEEVCLYTVKDDKVSRAEFFYHLPG